MPSNTVNRVFCNQHFLAAGVDYSGGERRVQLVSLSLCVNSSALWIRRCAAGRKPYEDLVAEVTGPSQQVLVMPVPQVCIVQNYCLLLENIAVRAPTLSAVGYIPSSHQKIPGDHFYACTFSLALQNLLSSAVIYTHMCGCGI